MTSTEDALQAVLAESRDFPQQFQTLNLATCSADGVPEASYAAYVQAQGRYYIYVSELATHAQNLHDTGKCSVLFIESEADAKHCFARRRLVLQCTAMECPRDSVQFERVMAQFFDKFGKFMDLIGGLKDFHLYELVPSRGNYVAGFAKAFALSGEDLTQVRWRDEKGHDDMSERNRRQGEQLNGNSVALDSEQ